MLVGKVTGNIWSTRKDEKLSGLKLMVVTIDDTANQSAPYSLIAADNAGAGIGDQVLVTQGTAARISAENLEVPIDAMIVGIIDALEQDETEIKGG